MSQAAVSRTGWTWLCAEPPGENFTWKGRHGTWTSAPAAPAGRDASCATLKCVPRFSARHPPGTRTPVATCVQVNGGGKKPEDTPGGLVNPATSETSRKRFLDVRCFGYQRLEGSLSSTAPCEARKETSPGRLGFILGSSRLLDAFS